MTHISKCLVYLSDHYVAATTAAQHAAFASAAEGFIALNTIVQAGGILFAIGWKLYRLASSSLHSSVAKQLEAGVVS